MTDLIRKQLIADIYALCARYELGFDDFLQELSTEMKEQAQHQAHPAVKSALVSCSQCLADASMDFYVSLK